MMLARSLVDKPDAVKIDVDDTSEDGIIVYRMYVDQSDMGKIIGKKGRVAKAIRQVARSAAIKKGIKISLEIMDEKCE